MGRTTVSGLALMGRTTVSGLTLATVFGALALGGCGGGSNSTDVAAVTATATAPQRTVTAATATSGRSAARGRARAGGSEADAGASSPSGGSAKSSPPSASTGVPYEVHTTSMEPTYGFGAKVYYDPTRTHPQIGDVIVFYLPRGGRNSSCGTVMEGSRACAVAKPGLTHTLVIKRVVGLPGDTIAIREGRVIRNGRPEPEPPTIHCGSEAGCNFPTAITVPAGAYYVMSDNRQLSHEDSRLWGAVPQAAIVGTVEGG
jgi:signal peptidase I